MLLYRDPSSYYSKNENPHNSSSTAVITDWLFLFSGREHCCFSPLDTLHTSQQRILRAHTNGLVLAAHTHTNSVLKEASTGAHKPAVPKGQV